MKQVTKRVAVGIALAAFGGFLAVGPTLAYAAGERVPDGPTVEVPLRTGPELEWGTSSLVDYVVPAWKMQSVDGSVLSRAGFNFNRYSPTGTEVDAPVHLPSGALIHKVELDGCDSSSTDQVVFFLFRVASDGSSQQLSPLNGTGTPATPGCGVFQQPLPALHQVDNYLYAYYVFVKGGTTSSTSYSAARVYYSLQVSPAPGTATFPNDVPTSHSFFRFVEAMAASGITGGCGPGSFCPDSPVTRGQMAVFLATALGLHYPD